MPLFSGTPCLSYITCEIQLERLERACHLFQLTYLEDPDVGEVSLAVMVSQEQLDTLNMVCRGGDNCCGKADNRLCGEGKEDLQSTYILKK